jgi:uncharacterized protein YkwD
MKRHSRPLISGGVGLLLSLAVAVAGARSPASGPGPQIGEPVALDGPPELVPPVPPGRSPGRLGLDYTGCGGVTAPVVHAGYEQEVVERTNTERQNNGNLPPLKRVSSLDAAARYHSTDIAQDNYFQHDSYDRNSSGQLVLACSWSTRLSSYYSGWLTLAENIAAGYVTPQDVMAGWMGSSGHRANILSTASWELGVGYHCCAGGYSRYWSQDFGRRSGVYPLVIERERATTTQPNVSLYVYGSWSEIRLRNDSDPWGAWQPFSSNVSWTLPSAPGVHTVAAEMRTGSQTAAASDTIELLTAGTNPPPTATRTSTPVPPTATRTRTSTAVPPTATRTRTSTPVPPTATRTSTTAAPTATRTNTPVPPTATRTRTSTAVPPTATRTRTSTAVPTATSVVVNLSASHDAHVRSSSPDTNYGTSTGLRVRRATNLEIRSFLKFDVAGVSGPVRRATLRLFVYDGSSVGGSAYAVANTYRQSGTPWVEGGITWNNAPSLVGSPLATLGAVSATTWVELDVTAAVTGNGSVSFGLSSTVPDLAGYNSRQAAANRPVLTIQMGP